MGADQPGRWWNERRAAGGPEAKSALEAHMPLPGGHGGPENTSLLEQRSELYSSNRAPCTGWLCSAHRHAARRSPRRASTSPHGGRLSWSPRGVSAAAAPLISLQRVCGSCGRQQGVSWPLRPRAALPLADRAPCSRSQRRLLACVSASATGNGGSSALLTLPGLASLMHARRVDPAKIWAARSVPSWHNLRLVYQRGIWPCG